MKYLVVDLEATCADDNSIPAESMEIIEIGACWATETGEVIDRFQCYVRPLERPKLTTFCETLTGIAQSDVDSASLFPAAANALGDFAGKFVEENAIWISWGAYDFKQLTRETQRHGVPFPLRIPHKNAKRMFAKEQRIGKEVGMSKACALANLPMEGAHHRGLDDAVNIARLIPWILGARCLPGRSPCS